MGEVVALPVVTTAYEPAEDILNKAKGWGLSDVLVVGYVDGELAVGGNMSDLASIVFLLEKAKAGVMRLAE